jgi:hypothetical protein
MDVFFSLKNKYVVNASVDSVQTEIKSLTDRRWYDFSENITGKLKNNGSFEFSPKWTFGAVKVFGIPQSMTYLSGTITEDNGKTIIEITSRSNYVMVVFFYFLIFTLVAKLFDINTFMQATLTEMLLAIPIICLVLAGIMTLGAIRLRDRFERLMQLRRGE